ncbi:SDR family oxidoreductase [Povalibacter sp.]|uniref:SDR family oxidoreductase n=1 Tax=Povalibacter sp. TaxID=1962978 RepID=UPI002F42DFBD
MKILLTGATGFIGSHLAPALTCAGHRVVAAQRRPSRASEYVIADFSRDHADEIWEERLAGFDAVINAVGIIREQGDQTFDALHTRAPRGLFAACAHVGISKVIQISALGAPSGVTPYFASKHAADEFLASLPVAWTIVYPSLVYGTEGASAQLFETLASLPLIPLPGEGLQRLQPVHIDDVVAAIVAAVSSQSVGHQRIALVGPEAFSLRDYLATLRRSMELGRPHFIHVPMPLVRAAASAATRTGVGLLDRNTLTMLNAGNVADAGAIERLLQRPPRSADEFIDARQARSAGITAVLRWMLPLVRLSIAIVWLWSGITSFGLYPRELSYDMLSASFIPAAWQPPVLVAAASLDVLLGIATLALRRRQMLWLLQIAVMGTYTLIISATLPDLWLHPFGPVLKNLPTLAAILLLYCLEPLTERSQWNT